MFIFEVAAIHTSNNMSIIGLGLHGQLCKRIENNYIIIIVGFANINFSITKYTDFVTSYLDGDISAILVPLNCKIF